MGDYFEEKEKTLDKGGAFLIDGELAVDRAVQLFSYDRTYPMPEFPKETMNAFWKTQQIAYDFPKSIKYPKVVLAEMIMVLIFWLLLIVGNSFEYNSTEDKNLMHDQIKNILLNNTEYGKQSFEFNEVTTTKKVYLFLNATFVRLLKWDVYYNKSIELVDGTGGHDKLSSFLIGFPRLRMKKVSEHSCSKISENNLFNMVKTFKPCYSTYSGSHEDRLASHFSKEHGYVHTDLRQYSQISRALTKGSEIVYPGIFDKYPDGGFVTSFLSKMDITTSQYDKGLTVLEKNEWINRATRVVFIEANMYSINLHTFTFIRIAIEQSMFGEIHPNFEIVTVRFFNLQSKLECLYYGIMYLLLGFSIFFIIEELWELIYLRFEYIVQFWTYVDITIIIITVMSFSAYKNADTFFTDHIWRREQHEDIIFDDLIRDQWNHRLYLLIAMYLTTFKMIRYVHNFSFMYTFTDALLYARKGLWEMLLYVLIFLVALALLGMFSFGIQNYYFMTFTNAFYSASTVFAKLLKYENMEAANKAMAPFYLVMLFLFFVGFKFILTLIIVSYIKIISVTTLYRGSAAEKMICAPCTRLYRRATAQRADRIRLHYLDKTLSEECGFTRLELIVFLKNYEILISNSLPPAVKYPTESSDADIMRTKKIDTKLKKPTDNKPLTKPEIDMLRNYLDIIETQVEIMSERLLGMEEAMYAAMHPTQISKITYSVD